MLPVGSFAPLLSRSSPLSLLGGSIRREDRERSKTLISHPWSSKYALPRLCSHLVSFTMILHSKLLRNLSLHTQLLFLRPIFFFSKAFRQLVLRHFYTGKFFGALLCNTLLCMKAFTQHSLHSRVYTQRLCSIIFLHHCLKTQHLTQFFRTISIQHQRYTVESLHNVCLQHYTLRDITRPDFYIKNVHKTS